MFLKLSDDQNYTDGTENMQNDWSNMMEGQIIVKFTTAFVENGIHTTAYTTITCAHSIACLVVHLKPYHQVLHGWHPSFKI